MKISYYTAVNSTLNAKYNPETNILTIYINGMKHCYAFEPQSGFIKHLLSDESYTKDALNKEIEEGIE